MAIDQGFQNKYESMLDKDEDKAQSMLEDRPDIVDTCMICGCNTHRSAFDDGSQGPTQTICPSCFEAHQK